MWGSSLRSITAIKEIIKSPFTLIYRKMGEGGEGEAEPEDKAKAGLVRLSKEGLEVKVKEGEESSDEEIEDLQHVAAATSAASGSSLYVSQPHQWEKVDFATFSWCKVQRPTS